MLASGLKKNTIWAPSMSLASASSKSDGHSTSKQDSKSDVWSLLRTPCLDRDGETIGILDFKQAVAIPFPDVHCHV